MPILSAFPGFYPLLELFFQFVASPVLHYFFLQNRIIFMRFYLSFMWFQSWCTQIVPSIFIYSSSSTTSSISNKSFLSFLPSNRCSISSVIFSNASKTCLSPSTHNLYKISNLIVLLCYPAP